MPKFTLKWFQNTGQHGNAGKKKGRAKINLGRASWLGRDVSSLPVTFPVFKYYSQTLKVSSLPLGETKLQQRTMRKRGNHAYIYRVSNREGERESGSLGLPLQFPLTFSITLKTWLIFSLVHFLLCKIT